MGAPQSPTDRRSVPSRPESLGDYSPFWSPDSKSIGFFTEYSLKRSDVGGGPPQTICRISLGRGASWSAEGVILFSAFSTGHAVHRVTASGGTPTPVTTINLSLGESSHYWPYFLPDNRHFLYSVTTGPADLDSGIRIGNLDSAASSQGKLLLPAVIKVAYAGQPKSGRLGRGLGHLMFVQGRTLMAQKFDLGKLQLEGNPFMIAEHAADFSVAENGVVALASGNQLSRLVLRDRSGKQLKVLAGPARMHSPSFSTDGKRLAFDRTDATSGNCDIWVADLDTDITRRFTTSPNLDWSPVWSPDDSQIAFSSGDRGRLNAYRKNLNGAAEEEPERLTEDANSHLISDWSPDGRFLLITELAKGSEDLMILPLIGGRKALEEFVRTEFGDRFGRFSPDGRSIAYTSAEAGLPEIYVQPFVRGQRTAGSRRQVSVGGGVQPRWRSSGGELYYLAPDGKMMIASVLSDGGTFRVRKPSPLFSTTIDPAPAAYWQFDVTADGQRFVLAEPTEEMQSRSITLLINWMARTGS